MNEHEPLLWSLASCILLFLFIGGAMLIETGLSKAKNAANCVVKTIAILVTVTTVWSVAAGILFNWREEIHWPALSLTHGLLAATTAILATLGLADRTRLRGTLVIALSIGLVAYPVVWLVGRCISGWHAGIFDVSNTMSVHIVSAAGALAATSITGPRLGKYYHTGESIALPGHNLPLTGLGLLLVWAGWMAFVTTSLDMEPIKLVRSVLNLQVAAGGGAIAALVLTKSRFGKLDATLVFNGVVAGLVAVGPLCHRIPLLPALSIGILSGILVLRLSLWLDAHYVDDPAGIVATMGGAGITGVVLASIFDLITGNPEHSLWRLILAIMAAVIGFSCAWIAALFARRRNILRLPPTEEMEGLDSSEYGIVAYPEFHLREN